MADVVIVGAGIVGLAHALAAAKRGKRVVVLDRDAQANGASIRNFGFVTVTGQARGRVWNLARRSAAVWREVAGAARIPIVQQGLLLVAQRPEAVAVLDAFAATEMAEECARIDAGPLATRYPMVRDGRTALLSSTDVRVESRTAIPQLTRWLAEAHSVEFRWNTAVGAVSAGRVATSGGVIEAETIVVCPGDDRTTLFPDMIADAGITRCKLQMLRLADPGWRIAAPVMSDLSLSRYLGYAALPQAEPLRQRLAVEAADALDHGIHLIVTQSADGSLIVGDSHHYAPTPDPFAEEAIDAAILEQYAAVLGTPPPVVERWTGTYASGPDHSIVAAPADGVRLVIVTSGTGASTAFALAEDVIADLFG